MDATTLLRHRDFVTAVARALLGNEADVEDAVQETYVAALQSDPPRTGRVRPWLGGITRNVARNLRRTRARRRRREESVARPDRATAACTEKLRWQQRVVEEVLDLEPIYRDVLLLRYYEDLPPRAIASRLDLPVNTVRTRTRRAVDRLRARFDRKYGRKAWAGALAAWFVGESAFAGKLIVAALVALVAGTVWIGRSAIQGESAAERRIARTTQEERAASGGASADAAAVRSATAQPERPRVFRGRILDFDAKPHTPIAGATVHLTLARGEFYPLASATTDADGRFSIPWRSGWGKPGVRNGYAYQHLYVVHDGHWTEAMFTPAKALDEPVDLAVQLLAHPRIRFVQGEARTPVAGVQVALHKVPLLRHPRLEPPLATDRTGADGLFAGEWPTHRAALLLRARLPDGDLLQWQLDQTEVRSFDPYDVAIDPEEFASVSVRVLDAEGKPAGRDTQLFVLGVWAPDAGDSEEADLNALVRGAQPRPLFGATDRDGRVTFRFPADRAQHGAYVPHGMVAWDGAQHVAFRAFFERGRLLEQIARNGRSLPTLRFGAGLVEQSCFVVADVGDAEYALHWRSADGETRVFEVYPLVHLPGRALCQLADRLPEELRGDATLSIVAESKHGIAWSSMDETAFERHTAKGGAFQLGPARGTRKIQLLATSQCSYSLTAVRFPFARNAWLVADEADTFEIPDAPGLWRLKVGKLVETFDPAKRSSIEIDTPPVD